MSSGFSLSMLPPPKHAAASHAKDGGSSLKSRNHPGLASSTTERVNAIIAATASSVQKVIPPYGHRQHYLPQQTEVILFFIFKL